MKRKSDGIYYLHLSRAKAVKDKLGKITSSIILSIISLKLKVVKDEGIGISRYNLEKIFERYYRVEDHAIQFQGLGIGLFISYEIIQRHHGKLWAEIQPGKGSTFYFTIPVYEVVARTSTT